MNSIGPYYWMIVISDCVNDPPYYAKLAAVIINFYNYVSMSEP